MSVQETIKALRLALGLTQEQLARSLDVTLRTIARYENDRPPTDMALVRLYTFAVERDQQELADVLLKAYWSEASAALGVSVKKGFDRLDAVVNSENIDAAGELLKEMWKVAAIFDQTHATKLELTEAGQKIRRLTQTMADRILVKGRKEL